MPGIMTTQASPNSGSKTSRSTAAPPGPGWVLVCGGKLEAGHYRIKVVHVTDEPSMRQAVGDAYKKVYINPEGLRPIIPPQHLVDTTFALKLHVPNCRLAQYLIFSRLRDLGAQDQGSEVFTDSPEGEGGTGVGTAVGLLTKQAMRKLLEQVSTATWVFQDKKGEAVQAVSVLPAGWPARRASLG